MQNKEHDRTQVVIKSQVLYLNMHAHSVISVEGSNNLSTKIILNTRIGTCSTENKPKRKEMCSE